MTWRITADFDPQMPYGALRQFAFSLDAAIIEAIERTISEIGEGGLTLGLTSGAGDAVERRLTFKRRYQVAELPCAVGEATFASAEEAIAAMREFGRNQASQTVDYLPIVIRQASGSFRIGLQQRDGCDFDSETDAASALSELEDPTRFAVIPYVEVSWET